ncbi:MAG TPA: hypothetical protein PK970_00220 [Hyphomicrobiaceae bacterium]|nr:hypothetical protein [Hyphomicrobiaceae bacterium]
MTEKDKQRRGQPYEVEVVGARRGAMGDRMLRLANEHDDKIHLMVVFFNFSPVLKLFLVFQ